jgi:flagellar capping protein FliD
VLLETKIQEISGTIGTIMQGQLEVLNENMRKIDIKENSLRGKRIYDYSKQVDNIRQSVSGVVDALKDREINKFACNELILEEAKAIKEQARAVEQGILELSAKLETSETELQEQISSIIELMGKLNSKSEVLSGESEGEDSSDGASS